MNQWNKIYKKEGSDYRYCNINKPHEDMAKVARFFKKYKVKKILDLGCGAGRNLKFLVKRGFDMYGIDIAPHGIKFAKNALKLQKKLKVGGVFKKLPYRDNFFDAVVSVQVLQHGVENQILKAIKEIKRVLQPKGFVFITLSGRTSKGEVRYTLVKTAKRTGERTYIPKIGNEAGLVHFIYNKKIIKKHYKDFRILRFWKDKRDYYCFLARVIS